MAYKYHGTGSHVGKQVHSPPPLLKLHTGDNEYLGCCLYAVVARGGAIESLGCRRIKKEYS